MSDVAEKTRLIRVLTYGKAREDIEQEVLQVVLGGARALVQIGERQAVPEGEPSAVGEWANALCRENGLLWRRVGRDVLFTPAATPDPSEANPMLIQYSRRAQRALAQARDEAGQRGTEIIGTEHLLLALLDDTHCVAWRVMDHLGGGTEAILTDLRSVMPSGDGITDGAPAGESFGGGEDVPLDLLPLTEAAQRAVGLARAESRRTEEYSVGTGHLLIGLLAQTESLAAQSLSRHGIDPERVGQEMAREQEP